MLARLRDMGRLSRRAFLLAWHASPSMLLGLLALLGVQAALTPVQLALCGRVIDAAASLLGTAPAAGQAADSQPGLWTWIGLLAAAMATGQLIQPVSQTFQSMLADRMGGHVTGEVIRATNRWQGLARFEDPTFADDVELAGVRAPRAGLDLVLYGARAIVALWSMAALAVVLAGLHVAAPILVVLAAVPAVARTFEFQSNTGSKIYVHTPEARKLPYFRTVMTSPEPAKDIRLLGLGHFFRRRFDEAYDRTVGDLNRTRWQLTTRMCLASALAAAAPGAVFVYATWQISTGAGSLGDLVLYGGAAVALQVTLTTFGFSLGFLPMVYAFLPSLTRVLDAPPDLPVAADPCPAPRPVRTGVVFENVGFSYPGRDERVLDGLDLALRPGESLALVGHNGSGKTTIVKLLLRLYDPTEGRILLDGRDLRDYDLTDLRRELGVLFQDFLHYELTAAENIGFGRVERLSDRSLLAAAAERAGASELLDSLPEGLDTRLGAQFGGRQLSGGEWQKLALARAFVRDAALLVLDEPTAALDPQAEYDVFERFAELTRGRMTVLVSHRFSTVRMADRIVVLAAGRVIESGTHEELMAASGEYARLYTVQASQYLGAEPDATALRAERSG